MSHNIFYLMFQKFLYKTYFKNEMYMPVFMQASNKFSENLSFLHLPYETLLRARTNIKTNTEAFSCLCSLNTQTEIEQQEDNVRATGRRFARPAGLPEGVRIFQ